MALAVHVDDVFQHRLGFGHGNGWGDRGVDHGGGGGGGVELREDAFALARFVATGEDMEFVLEGWDQSREFFAQPDDTVGLGEVEMVDLDRHSGAVKWLVLWLWFYGRQTEGLGELRYRFSGRSFLLS